MQSNNINGNVITLNEAGLRLESSRSNTIQDNLIAYNYGPNLLEKAAGTFSSIITLKTPKTLPERRKCRQHLQSTLTSKETL